MTEVVRATGTVAGLVAVLGLVVLSALYVAHAREVRRLREWAGSAPERARPAKRRPRLSRRSRRGLGSRSLAVAIGAGLVVGGSAAFGISRLTADGHRIPSPAPAGHPRPAVKPGRVTVAVLNVTTTPGLAASLRDRLTAAGFKPGTIDVYPDQQLAASVVQYAPGRQAAAKAIARRLGIRRRERVTPDARALAGDATVVVIAGPDVTP
jgi:hypothetical protein